MTPRPSAKSWMRLISSPRAGDCLVGIPKLVSWKTWFVLSLVLCVCGTRKERKRVGKGKLPCGRGGPGTAVLDVAALHLMALWRATTECWSGMEALGGPPPAIIRFGLMSRLRVDAELWKSCPVGPLLCVVGGGADGGDIWKQDQRDNAE